jgi:1-acyl-sn-glycerol-3-phosphate acyltransferase
MAALRSLLYALIFYPATLLWVLAGLVAGLIGRKPTLAVVLNWVALHHWLVRNLLGIRLRI